jgi:hypothetical protein
MNDLDDSVALCNADENSHPHEFVWGTEAIAKIIGRTPRQTFHLLAGGKLKTPKKVGGIWCANRTALRRELGAA